MKLYKGQEIIIYNDLEGYTSLEVKKSVEISEEVLDGLKYYENEELCIGFSVCLDSTQDDIDFFLSEELCVLWIDCAMKSNKKLDKEDIELKGRLYDYFKEIRYSD